MKHSSNSNIAVRLLHGALIALVAVGSTTALVAQSKSTPKKKVVQQKEGYKFGGYLSFVMPNGDFADLIQSGFGLGGFFEVPFTANWAGVASLQYNAFGEKSFGLVKTSATTLGLNVDAHYYFEGKPTGFYALAGLGYNSVKTTATVEIPFLGKAEESTSNSDVGFNIGAGYYFSRNLGAEARYSTCDDLKWIQASLKYRF